MPISPENRARYPADWPKISLEVRQAAGWKCEGSPAYPDCRAKNGELHPVTGSRVVLTVAHLDHTPENRDRANLRAWCQRCHLRYDSEEHHRNAAATRRRRRAVGDLFDKAPDSRRIVTARVQSYFNANARWYAGRDPGVWGEPLGEGDTEEDARADLLRLEAVPD